MQMLVDAWPHLASTHYGCCGENLPSSTPRCCGLNSAGLPCVHAVVLSPHAAIAKAGRLVGKPQSPLASCKDSRAGKCGCMPVQASDVLAGLLKKAGAADGALPKGAAWPPGVPQLPELFRAGQLVRCTVMDLQQVRAAGFTVSGSVLHVLSGQRHQCVIAAAAFEQ